MQDMPENDGNIVPDIRDELVKQLMLYQAFKEVVAWLDKRPQLGLNVFKANSLKIRDEYA